MDRTVKRIAPPASYTIEDEEDMLWKDAVLAELRAGIHSTKAMKDARRVVEGYRRWKSER